jgi:CubicO group peptidase (beta-lactamase class C family)
MTKRAVSTAGRVAVSLLACTVLVWPLAAATPTAKPEEVGLSPERLKRIDELVQRHLDAGSFAGAVTLIARHGRIGHIEAHGLMDIESRKPMQKDAIFRIMSMTKPVVGVSILMLIEEGKVRLTDPASKWIPALKGLKVAVAQPAPAGPPGPATSTAPAEPRFYAVPAEREITIRDLLTHTSGLGSGTISNFTRRAVALKGKESLSDFIPRLGQTVLEFQPGTRWAYSAQDGFDVLARIVEIVSGMPYDRFAKTRIFDPLGMKDTFFYPADGHARMATLYQRVDGKLQKQNNPNFMNGAYFSGGGGLFSTPEDYLQFGLMLVNGGQHNGKRLLAPRTVEMMASIAAPDSLPGRPRGESFGLSVRVVNDPMARNSFLSEGSYGWSGAFGTHFWVDPKERMVAVVMTQTSNQEFLRDFENMVMQAIVGNGTPAGTQ